MAGGDSGTGFAIGELFSGSIEISIHKLLTSWNNFEIKLRT